MSDSIKWMNENKMKMSSNSFNGNFQIIDAVEFNEYNTVFVY